MASFKFAILLDMGGTPPDLDRSIALDAEAVTMR
jgi:hypothetical protein